jgi:hypothetical protein
MNRAIFFVATTFAGIIVGAWIGNEVRNGYNSYIIEGAVVGLFFGAVIARMALNIAQRPPKP